MKFRNLRIAWSVLWGIACLSLLLLWARSYSRADVWLAKLSATRTLRASSQWGEASLLIEVWRPPTPVGAFHSGRANRLRRETGVRRRAESQFGVQLPHYSFAILAIGLAAVAWMRRFTLRTLLVATALIAAFLTSAATSK
jgi:hypothetical protein